ncbi:MAG TPA: nitrate/sulfonate/bicarbonate ABC transporter ATP-binding protein [Acidimicrobiales bacterium]|nr:nitrate/sulfonate/bicarbonate ABC transporter ATP-binding protein [Acidimicrobiales bacterium]
MGVSTLIDVQGVTKTFDTLEGPLPVLDDVSLQVRQGEIVALLGKSGSGKSTLLRCIAGLVAPSGGNVSFRGQAVTGPNPGTAMVFQTFALLPWLTVQQNVELGLEARGVAPDERARRADRAIDLIGLDGFESAFPKELSGGMRQRVGFARALVVEPEVLLMDEPFSALDVLTAENLRGELLELWENDDFPIEAILLVTHNIEEAVILADRVVVLGANPGRIRAELPVVLPRPRDRNAPEFNGLVEAIYAIMTGRPEADATLVETRDDRRTLATVPLPHATVDALSGLAEIMAQLGPMSIAELADELSLEVDDLLAIVDALELLTFAEVEAGRIRLTPEGATFAGADIQASKQIFATAVLAHAPLIKVIVNGLERARDHTLLAGFFTQVLRRTFDEGEAHRQLEVALDWGRYAELYTFDAAHDELELDPGRVPKSPATT